MNLLSRLQAWWQGVPSRIVDSPGRTTISDHPSRQTASTIRPTDTSERHGMVVRDRATFVDLLVQSLELHLTKKKLISVIEAREEDALSVRSRLGNLDILLEYGEKYRGPETELTIAQLEEWAESMREQLHDEFGYIDALEHARQRLADTEATLLSVLNKIYASTEYWVTNSEPRHFAGLECDDDFQTSLVVIGIGASRVKSDRSFIRTRSEAAAQACRALVALRRESRQDKSPSTRSNDAGAQIELLERNEKEARTEFENARTLLTLAERTQRERESEFMEDVLKVLVDNGLWKELQSPSSSEHTDLSMISQHEPKIRSPSPFIAPQIIQDLEFIRSQVAVTERNVDQTILLYQSGMLRHLILYGEEGRDRWNEIYQEDHEGDTFEVELEKRKQTRAEALENYQQCKMEAKRRNIQYQPFTPPGYAPVPAAEACYPPSSTGSQESGQERRRVKVTKWASGVARGSPASFAGRTSLSLDGSPNRPESWLSDFSSPTSSRAGLIKRAKGARVTKAKVSTRQRDRVSRELWQERLRNTMKRHGRAAKLVDQDRGQIDWTSFYPDVSSRSEQQESEQDLAQHDPEQQSAEESNSDRN